MLKAPEVATMLGLSARAVYDLADSGMLACYRLGVGRGAVRFASEDVEAYRAAHQAPEPPMSRLSARELRPMEKLRLAAEPVGGFDLPPLTPEQHFHAFGRHRNTRRTPWADPAAIAAIYAEARRLTVDTGVPHHVDHIIPLKGERVSGLHVESNLRVLPRRDNILKSNRADEC